MHEAGGALRALQSVLRRPANALRTSPWRRRALTAIGCVAALVLLAMMGSGYDLPDRIASPTSTTATTQPPIVASTSPSTTDAGIHASGSERSTRLRVATLPATSTSVADTTTTTVLVASEPAAPPVDPNAPAVVARPIPTEPPPPPPAAPPPPWAGSTRTTGAGHVAVDVGCAGGRSAGAIDAFLCERVGPV